MMSYLKKLEKLKAPIFADIVEDIILGWLPTSYKDFIMHFHMHEKAPILDEIHQSLKQVEVKNEQGKEWEKHLSNFLWSNKINKKEKGKKIVFVIDINLTTSIYDWVIDTRSCAYVSTKI